MQISNMSELKRISLHTIAPDIGFQTTDIVAEREKKNAKEKAFPPSIRFDLNLFESNEQKCPEFNYADLLKTAEKKRRKEKKKDENGSNGIGGLDDGDDDKILDIARYFESKYGKRKKNDNIDLGAGYDESDSFIDNTDAYDELVPEEVTTVLGGFYINCGPLEFKNTDNAKNLARKQSNDKENGNDDEDDDEESDDDDDDEDSSDESSDEDSDEPQVAKKKTKRVISLSDTEEAAESNPPVKKKAPMQEVDCTIVD